MPQTALRPHDQRLPPVLNIIALTTFAANLSVRALDPVLPHVADEFGVSIATAAGFAAVFAFTFAIVQPLVGAAADLFGKARLMIFCLALLGLANLLGAISTSFPLLFATRILAGIGSGGVFPVSLGLTSDLDGADKRQVAIGRTLAGSMTGNLLGASASGLIGDFLGWRGVLAVLGALVIAASLAVAAGFRGADLKPPPRAGRSRASGCFSWAGVFAWSMALCGICHRTIRRSPRHCAVAALVLLFHGPDHRAGRLWARPRARRQGADLAWRGGRDDRIGLCLRAALAAAGAGRRGRKDGPSRSGDQILIKCLSLRNSRPEPYPRQFARQRAGGEKRFQAAGVRTISAHTPYNDERKGGMLVGQ